MLTESKVKKCPAFSNPEQGMKRPGFFKRENLRKENPRKEFLLREGILAGKCFRWIGGYSMNVSVAKS